MYCAEHAHTRTREQSGRPLPARFKYLVLEHGGQDPATILKMPQLLLLRQQFARARCCARCAACRSARSEKLRERRALLTKHDGLRHLLRPRRPQLRRIDDDEAPSLERPPLKVGSVTFKHANGLRSIGKRWGRWSRLAWQWRIKRNRKVRTTANTARQTAAEDRPRPCRSS